MGDKDRVKLKSLCYRCHVNKWIVDFKEGCAANISSISVCLACEQAEKISKLEKAMREKDIEIKKMKDIISKLQQKMEEADRTEREADQVNTRGESAGCSSNERPSASYCKQSQKLGEKVKELSDIVKANRDTIVESGREIVEIRQEIAAVKSNSEFRGVGGREAARGFVGGDWGGVALTNRFSVLSQEETYLIGDSIVGGQTERFANFNKKKRKVKSFPGCRVNKVTEEVEKLEIQSRNSCVIAHVGSNDLYLRGGRVWNSEPIVKDMKRLVNKVSEKTNKGIVVGMLPRSYVSHFALSKAIAINERMKKYCDQKKVEFIDLWGMFVGKRHLFRKDGIHLSEAGQRKFGEILNKECEKVMRSDRIGTRESSEVSPVSRLQGIEENENLEYSFLGFTQEN